jgi:hypothetical protein
MMPMAMRRKPQHLEKLENRDRTARAQKVLPAGFEPIITAARNRGRRK